MTQLAHACQTLLHSRAALALHNNLLSWYRNISVVQPADTGATSLHTGLSGQSVKILRFDAWLVVAMQLTKT